MARFPSTAVAASRGSAPASTPRTMAASATERVIGPGVSCEWDMGMMPERLTSPTVGLRPTIPEIDAGLTIDPSVSVPIANAARFAETATAEPELEPLGLRSSAYGLRVKPPVALHPLMDHMERMLAHSLKLAFPS